VTLFPNLWKLPRTKRRLMMLALWPIVWVEANINFFLGAYHFWKLPDPPTGAVNDGK
jgi:hypothetical protein